MNREKVIKGFDVCLEHGLFNGEDCHGHYEYTDNLSDIIKSNDYSKQCPYNGCKTGCVKTLAKDVFALLKEQEARAMTLEEVKAFDWDYCYLEEERLPGHEYRAVCGDYALTCITWPCVTSMRIQHGDDSYGKKWRCWSAKPTDEQRQEVKWND